MIQTTTSLLTRAIGLLEHPELEECPPGTACAITGEPIVRGIRLAKVVKSSTSEFLDTFGGKPSGFASPSAASLYAVSSPRRKTSLRVKPGGPIAEVSNCPSRAHLAFADGEYWMPMTSRETAEKRGWACWSDAVRDVWPRKRGVQCVVLLTDNFKKRLWPYVKPGILGARTNVFVCASKQYSLSASLTIDWGKMLGILDSLERLYVLGASKAMMRDSLLGSPKFIELVGMVEAIREERELQQVRDLPEFWFALIIAQKPLEQRQEQKPLLENTECPIQPTEASASPPESIPTSCYSQLSLL